MNRPLYNKEDHIGLVIVESHQHVLEHIHSIIRKRKLFESWSMVHFDAHPDMACPSHVPAAACFVPRQPWEDFDDKGLYELLDSTSSGIAEWILPLVLAAGLQRMEWIKPQFSTQLPIGDHAFHVGVYDSERSQSDNNAVRIDSFLDFAPTARIKVDWRTPYYLDDDSVVPLESLSLPRSFELKVSEGGHYSAEIVFVILVGLGCGLEIWKDGID